MTGQAEMKSAVFVTVAVIAVVTVIVMVIVLLTSSISLRVDFFTTQQVRLFGTGNVGAAGQGRTTALNRDGTTLAIGGVNNDSDRGAVWVFVRTIATDAWTLQQLLIPAGIVPADQFGLSIAISDDGNTLAISGRAADDMGGVWIFNRVETVWTENAVGKILPVTYPLIGPIAYFGWSLSMSGDGNMFVAGTIGDNTNIGAAYVYEKTNSVWTEKQKLIGTGGIGLINSQGISVSVSRGGDVIAVGGISDNAYVGATWIFTRSGTTYVQAQKIVGTGGTNSQQGSSVCLSDSGNILAVGGAADNAFLGAVWMFKREGALWVQEGAKLVGTGLEGTSRFGVAVALNGEGNVLAASCQNSNFNEGGFFAFINNGSGWTQKDSRKITTSGSIGPTLFGSSLSMSRDGLVLAVGARFENSFQGATYIFI